VKVTVDERHADPRIGRVRVGDTVRLGTAIGVTMEPDWLWARLVGILKRHEGIGPYVLRKYVDGDGWYPTGEYVRTSFIGLVPWTGAGVRTAHRDCPNCNDTGRRETVGMVCPICGHDYAP
jgi:hypothetical protein